MLILFRNPKVMVWICYFIALCPAGFYVFYLIRLKGEFVHHQWACGLGFIILSGNAILIFRLFPLCKTVFMKYVHFLILGASLGAIIFGLVKAMMGRKKDQDPTHQFIGWLAVAMYSLNFLVGLFIFLYVRVTQAVRRWYTGFHAFFGFSSFFLGVLAVTSGVRSLKDLSAEDDGAAQNVKSFAVFFGGFVYFILLNPCFEWVEIGNI